MHLPTTNDPYDPWVTRLGVYAKQHFYRGHLRGKLLAVAIGVADWLMPTTLRSLLGSTKRLYPITVAQWILSQDQLSRPRECLDALMSTTSANVNQYGVAWGLGFPWMSKNGFYDSDTPFITHTPYALEALIRIYQESTDQESSDLALGYFKRSWQFLDSLKIVYQDGASLALSYAPVVEPRIVINANSYAALSYAMHVRYADSNKQEAMDRCGKLTTWVISQQNDDGSWRYYADNSPGNFIDGFHTCFILKNLTKVSKLMPELEPAIVRSVQNGIKYVDEILVDQKSGLLRRFSERDIVDPFTWDLYDQAEYLGVLILMGRRDDAEMFLKKIVRYFYHKDNWYSRRDILGRRWGRNFLRWGVMPLLHQVHELKKMQKIKTESA